MLTRINPHCAEAAVHTISRRQTLPIDKQTGIVLPVALFALFAATILTLAFVKATTIALRVGGASVVTAETQAAAELQLSNFFRLNPINLGDPPDPRYSRERYSQTDDRCILAGGLFDCTNIASLPPHAAAVTPVVQRTGCGNAPRSSKPYQFGTKFNYYQVAASVNNTVYGSRAEVDAGVGNLVMACP